MKLLLQQFVKVVKVMKEHKVIISLTVGLLVVVICLILVIRSIFFSGSAQDSITQVNYLDSQQDMNSEMLAGQIGNNQPIYSTFRLYEQDPVSVSGSVQLQTDQQYFYDVEMGKIATVQVRDGQYVMENDVLYTYEVNSKQAQYDIEDALKEQTRLYNQREILISQLSQLTDGYYNYQGDKISSYWDNSGKQAYYIEESIEDSTGSDNSSEEDGTLAAEETLKQQVREVNQQIEDVEIKIIRLKENQHGRILASADGTVIINEAGKESNHVPFVRVVSDEVSIVGSVSEYEFYTLAKDRKVNIYVNAEDRNIDGKIIAYDQFPVSSTTNDSSQSASGISGTNSVNSRFNFTIKPDEYLQPGFTVKIGIKLPGVVVPTEAILEEAGEYYVYVYQEGTVEKRKVTIEQQGTNRVVNRELISGEILVLHPYDLNDGQAIMTDFDMMGLDNIDGMQTDMEDSW